MVLYPNVTTRSSYPIGTPPTFSIARPFQVHFSNTTVSVGTFLWVEGEQHNGFSTRGRLDLGTASQIWSLHPNPENPGLYEAEIRYDYEVPLLDKKTAWTWKPWRGSFPRSLFPHKTVAYSTIPGSDPLYACQFAVPVELKVVEPGRAEEIELLSDPNLDARMRKAFAAGPASMSGTYSTPKGKRSYIGGVGISYDSLPVPIAFGTMLRLANGDVIVPRDPHPECIRAGANTSGRFSLTIRDFQLEDPGQYNATLILKPDPDYGYRDPQIKALWNGTLEFPISFSVQQVSRP